MEGNNFDDHNSTSGLTAPIAHLGVTDNISDVSDDDTVVPTVTSGDANVHNLSPDDLKMFKCWKANLAETRPSLAEVANRRKSVKSLIDARAAAKKEFDKLTNVDANLKEYGRWLLDDVKIGQMKNPKRFLDSVVVANKYIADFVDKSAGKIGLEGTDLALHEYINDIKDERVDEKSKKHLQLLKSKEPLHNNKQYISLESPKKKNRNE